MRTLLLCYIMTVIIFLLCIHLSIYFFFIIGHIMYGCFYVYLEAEVFPRIPGWRGGIPCVCNNVCTIAYKNRCCSGQDRECCCMSCHFFCTSCAFPASFFHLVFIVFKKKGKKNRCKDGSWLLRRDVCTMLIVLFCLFVCLFGGKKKVFISRDMRVRASSIFIRHYFSFFIIGNKQQYMLMRTRSIDQFK